MSSSKEQSYKSLTNVEENRSPDHLQTSREKNLQQDLGSFEYSTLSVQELLDQHLAEFNRSVRAVTGELNPYLDSILDAQYLLKDEPKREDIAQEKSSKEESSLTYFFDIGKSDVETESPSIEDLLISQDFVECLNNIPDDTENMSGSVENMVSTANNKMKGIIAQKSKGIVEISSSLVKSDDALYSTENILRGEFAEEFRQFCESILGVTKKGMKDIFQGSNLQETVLDTSCIEIFKKMKRGTLNDFADIAGPKYILKEVKHDKEPKPFISSEDDDEKDTCLSMKSLYDCFLQNQEDAGFVEALHRVHIVGKYSAKNRLKTEDRFQKAVDAIQKDIVDSASKLTGALILLKHTFIHIAEGSTDAVDALIKATATIAEDGYLEQVKIVTKFNDIPNRHFRYWKSTYVKKKDKSSRRTDDKTMSDLEFIHKIKEFQRRIRKIGTFANNIPPSEFDEKMQSLTQIHLFPTDDLLASILERDFCLTPKAYVDMYMTQQIFKPLNDYERPPYFITSL